MRQDFALDVDQKIIGRNNQFSAWEMIQSLLSP
jgi:hypothetical protein